MKKNPAVTLDQLTPIEREAVELFDKFTEDERALLLDLFRVLFKRDARESGAANG